MSDQRDPKYQAALTEFSRTCLRLGLKQTEVVILAAQFTGMAIATGSVTRAHEAQLEVAAKAMRDAYANKMIGGAAPEIFTRQ